MTPSAVHNTNDTSVRENACTCICMCVCPSHQVRVRVSGHGIQALIGHWVKLWEGLLESGRGVVWVVRLLICAGVHCAGPVAILWSVRCDCHHIGLDPCLINLLFNKAINQSLIM